MERAQFVELRMRRARPWVGRRVLILAVIDFGLRLGHIPLARVVLWLFRQRRHLCGCRSLSNFSSTSDGVGIACAWGAAIWWRLE